MPQVPTPGAVTVSELGPPRNVGISTPLTIQTFC